MRPSALSLVEHVNVIRARGLTLGPQDVQVWYCLTASLREDAIGAAMSLLSKEERERSERFVSPVDQRDFTVAHALTRRMLATYGGLAAEAWRFDTDQHGKPHPARTTPERPPLRFNLSHTRGLVGCAVALDTDVGFDVESIDTAMGGEEVADRYFARNEIEFLARSSPSERPGGFVDLWTLKEAYLKATGKGLSHPLNAVSFTFWGDFSLRFAAPSGADDDAWQFALFALSDRYRMALAVRRTLNKTFRIHMMSADGTPAAPQLLRRSP